MGVEAAEQAGLRRAAAPRGFHVDGHALWIGGETGNADVGLFVEAVGIDVQAAFAAFEFGAKLLPECVVGVDDGVLQTLPMKQPCFDCAVFFHTAVVVQMVARQIGEHGGAEGRAVNAVLVKPVAGHFHGNTGCAVLLKLAQQGLQGNRVGRGVRGGLQAAPIAVADCADNGAGLRFLRQNINRLRQPLGNRCFAVGTGYADDVQAA